MAINSKVNTATDAVSAVRENPYVQKALSDEQLHDEVRSAFAAAQSLFEQMKSNTSPSKKLTNDKLFDELQTLATSIRDASDSIRDAKPARRSGGGGIGRLIGLTVVGAIAAIALSEGLRGKLLDALFGAEEEFQYTPSSAVNGSAPAATATATNGSAASKPAAAASVKTAAKPKAAAKKPAAKKDDAAE